MSLIKKHIGFIKDVFSLSWAAFGGPNAHIAMMLDVLVGKRKYLTEEELIELNALCQLLPGPTSTQTLTSIGYKIGGPKLAALTIFLWVLPAVFLMTAIGIGFDYFYQHNISLEFLAFVPAFAIALIFNAAYKISLKSIKDGFTYVIFLISAVVAMSIPHPVTPVVIILFGGFLTAFKYRSTENTAVQSKAKAVWIYFVLFLSLLILATVLPFFFKNELVILFDRFYRYGSLIFGGGQVLIPFMHADLVENLQWLTAEEFLTGFGLVQSLPGPVFSFSAFAGSMAMEGQGMLLQIIGGIVSALAVFLPGLLLIFFVYPIWVQLKQNQWVKAALIGLAASASGLVLAAAFMLLLKVEMSSINLAIILIGFAVLLWNKIQAPLLVLILMLIGLGFQFFG